MSIEETDEAVLRLNAESLCALRVSEDVVHRVEIFLPRLQSASLQSVDAKSDIGSSFDREPVELAHILFIGVLYRFGQRNKGKSGG